MYRSMLCIKKITQASGALLALVQSTKEKILGLGDGGGKMPSTKSAASTQKNNYAKRPYSRLNKYWKIIFMPLANLSDSTSESVSYTIVFPL